ncbi:MAG: MlaA family lipoprotein [Candidatus Binatia bacterium]
MTYVETPRRRALAAALVFCATALAAGVGRADPAPPSDAAAPAPSPAAVDDFALGYADEPTSFPDPFERTNRGVLWFDDQLARFVVDPVVNTYQFIVPGPARRAVRRVFLNVNSPSVLVNDLLQREWRDASITIQRFAVNTTIGIGGLFDPAAAIGMERHSSDFGQTLALSGVDSGPYLVLPFFGPNTTRDAFGGVVDLFLQPTLYFLPFVQIFIYEGSFGLSTREAYDEAIGALRESSVDYYSSLANAYYQTRTAEIWKRRGHHRPSDADEPSPTVAD